MKSIPPLAFGIAWLAFLPLAAWPQARPNLVEPPLPIAFLIRSEEIGIQANADMICARPELSDADRRNIQEIAKRAHETADKLAAKVGVKVLPTTTPAVELSATMQESAGTATEFNTLLTSRPDLAWMKTQAEGIRRLENLQSPDYPLLLKQVGVEQPQIQSAQAIITRLKADLQKSQLAYAQAYLAGTPAAQGLAMADYSANETRATATARLAVRALFTPEQNATLDWAILQKDQRVPAYHVLGYSTQPQSIKAPEDGKYALLAPGTKAPIAAVDLKKGQILGFRKADHGISAFADKQDFAIPESAGPFYWQRN